EKDGDKRFYLNGRRVFIMAAMTRGFWPKNGIFATPEMARKDMEMLSDLGLNMMLLHRAIGQPPVMEYADTMGLLTYEEPGGYRVTANRWDSIEGPDQQALELRRIKLERMIIRDRSLPSMIIYNLKNEAEKAPDEDDIRNVRLVHELDPSRIITYNSDRNREIPYYEVMEDDPYKLHMRPFDDNLYYGGWWDHHHWYAYAGYVDVNYNNPEFYLRGVVNGPAVPMPQDSLYRLNKSEVIFFGEEGAFGTMVRLGKIKKDLEGTGANGFREMEHLDWFHHYDSFLDETGYRSAYKTVDELTLSLGRNLHYFHGRNIENVRMSNIADAYNMNGWASASTRTDVVDMYRNPTADPSIIRHYTRPLYIAVKLRNKVVPAGNSPVADFFIINEKDVRGEHTLQIEVKGPKGSVILSREIRVDITGGEEFGELIYKGLQLPALDGQGYYMVEANLVKNGEQVADGYDDAYAVDYMTPAGSVTDAISVIETDGVVKDFLLQTRNITPVPYEMGSDGADVIIIGRHEPDGFDREMIESLLDRARLGASLIVLEGADLFAETIQSELMARPPYYKGGGILRYGNSGRHFVAFSPYLEGLPQAQGMSWEYQYFYSGELGSRSRTTSGLRLDTRFSDWIVSTGSQGSKEIVCALNRVSFGEGQIFLSTLNILPGLASRQANSSVAKKLFLNLIEKNQPQKEQ
ncbi:MAG TPA: hypothetical protein ENO05_05360, partial [Bacteroides sp.]|nr:hypothetical protein [Bacteroides sp.]